MNYCKPIFVYLVANLIITLTGGEDGPFGQLMKSVMTAGMQFGKQLTDQNPEMAEVMGFDESQVQL